MDFSRFSRQSSPSSHLRKLSRHRTANLLPSPPLLLPSSTISPATPRCLRNSPSARSTTSTTAAATPSTPSSCCAPTTPARLSCVAATPPGSGWRRRRPLTSVESACSRTAGVGVDQVGGRTGPCIGRSTEDAAAMAPDAHKAFSEGPVFVGEPVRMI